MSAGRVSDVTRRAFLGSIAAVPLAAAEKGQILSADWKRYADPATEFEVLRLTDPSYSSYLPAYDGRPLSRRGNFMLFASDRTGTLQAWRLDLKTGQSRQLTDGEALNASSLTLMPDERTFCCFRGRSLLQISFAGLREREVYTVAEPFEATGGFSVSGDGVHAVVAERRGNAGQLRLINIARKEATTVVEADMPLHAPMTRPGRAGILYRREDGSLWLVNYDGQQNRKLRTPAGTIGVAEWAPDGRTIIYIHMSEDRRQLNALRELTPDTNADQLLSRTSQFVHFGPNSDASVFVGASGSKASPYILLLLRIAKRELTVCEHRASDPLLVSPIFHPSSQRIFFESDRHGKPAIYSVTVERFVEKTETE